RRSRGTSRRKIREHPDARRVRPSHGGPGQPLAGVVGHDRDDRHRELRPGHHGRSVFLPSNDREPMAAGQNRSAGADRRHDQPGDVAPGDGHRARLLPVSAGRRPLLPGRAIGRRLLVLHRRDLDPAVRGRFSCAEAPLTRAKPSTRRVEREDVLLWLFASTPVLAWIAAQQLSFLATRSICATGHRWLLYLVMGPSLAAAAAAGAASWTKWKGVTDRTPMQRRFIALGGGLSAATCVISIPSLMI